MVSFSYLVILTLTKDAAMQLVLHTKDTTRRILKPKVMRSFYQQLSRGHVYIDFIK